MTSSIRDLFTEARIIGFSDGRHRTKFDLMLFGSKLGFSQILDLAVFTRSAMTPPKVNRFG